MLSFFITSVSLKCCICCNRVTVATLVQGVVARFFSFFTFNLVNYSFELFLLRRKLLSYCFSFVISIPVFKLSSLRVNEVKYIIGAAEAAGAVFQFSCMC